jgi:hypothetical protein
MKRFGLPFIFLFLLTACALAGSRQLSVADFGLQPDDGQNATLAVEKALKACAEQKIATLTFPKGRYDFWEDSVSKQSVGININHLQKLKIEGNGSLFVFHGLMSICDITHSSDICLSDFSVDWDRPFISQGEIIAAANDSIDIEIDSRTYPFSIKDERILFHGEDWERPVYWYNLYDKKSQDIVYRTLDMPLGENLFTQHPVRKISENHIRIYAQLPFLPEKGTIISLWHGRYMKNGIAIWESKHITLENIRIYHALSNGILGLRSENITLNNVNMTANTEKGRVFSLIADAFHFNTCKGLIKVENCCHTGQGDDFMNVHGMNIQIAGKEDAFSVDIPSTGKASSRNTIKEGDEMWLIDHQTLQRGETRTIRAITEIYENGRLAKYRIRFDKELPGNVSAGDLLENKTWSPDVTVRHCRILKKHRARGILVSTPGKILIENNYFNSAGTAILIEGDNNFWFESGACTDVVIRDNLFEDCFTSEWGKGVITITPSHHPENNTCPAYHKNIRIYNNTFKHFDHTLLYARSVENLLFAGNEIIQTFTYKPYGAKYGFFFDGCRKTRIEKNHYTSDFQGENIKIRQMNPTDIRIRDREMILSTE